jgi:Lipopolysaccharide biosynthesis proteins, LPS:glycosyltransferases
MADSMIPIFYSCDENFLKYCLVSMSSLLKNASPDSSYCVYILHTDISEAAQQTFHEQLAGMGLPVKYEFSFEDVSDNLNLIEHEFPLRDYYSKTTYYRLLIADMHPEYDKVIYLDADTIVPGDISAFYNEDISDYYLGACHEQVMVQIQEFGDYVEQCLGVSRHNYFNAGVLLINCAAFRSKMLLHRFLEELHTYDFVVTQDEDYLNLITKDHVKFLDQRWNTEIYGDIPYPIEEAKILHYIMFNKPWHYRDCPYGNIYLRYAKRTPVFDEISAQLDSYTDEEKARDKAGSENLRKLAVKETNREDNYLKRLNRDKRAKDRVDIVKKIEEFERDGRFFEDVEDDPPTKPLLPDDIDYLHKTPIDKLKTKIAFSQAHKVVDKLIKNKQLIIKDMKGIEHFQNLTSGAVITCNHFNAFDSFIIQLVYEAAKQKKRTFYRVIREGNYTSFPGFYGFLMRNCNTLPLSSDIRTMKKFFEATNTVLKNGHFVLVYPEQSMWWNYRKPKPLKNGAFTFSAKNGVPVLPCFITMRDTELIGEDGFPIQEYTVHISEPIYPDKNLPYKKQTEQLRKENYRVWKEIYEREYQMPLEYTTIDMPDIDSFK